MSQIIILCGPSGSGKSTHAQRLAADHVPGARILSSDALIEARCAEAGLSYAEGFLRFVEEVKPELDAALEKAFADGVPIIWDRTSLTWDSRAALLERTPDSYERIAIAFETPRDILIERVRAREAETGKHIPLDILDTQIEIYQRPHFDEGFDRILLIEAPGDRISVL